MSIKRENNRRTNRNYEVLDEEDVYSPASEAGYPYPFRSWSSTYIAEEDWHQPDALDILDLEKMAEEWAENQKHKNTRHITEAEISQCIPLAEANFEDIKQTDIRLERAYELYLLPALDSVPDVKRETEAMIKRLENQPHFYCPYGREETTKVHVGRWLDKHTCNPEKELTGFTSKDPYDLERFIPIVEPRLSTSDTNVILGKRKRVREREEETVYISGSSSDSRLVSDRGYRPRKVRKSR
ncbi:uncharacterized protein LOC128550156 [Mercenaria mercenaria]|uniref:uncharacterized protein LOC128550156 n=1 Tax=Mercenaria mercenaria TaxID=6596 RepID=UPI00234EC879|nr:uncharacterized protein LOC128550156 [Mercenaria mercenaria]